ncbi:MAG TPA: DinB family protein [Thermoanaerobaculia bacterium]
MASEIDLLLRFLDEGFDRKAWHGPNLTSALRGLTPEQASWRPATGRNCTWDLTLHCAYWKNVVRRRLGVDPEDRFPLPGSDWLPLPEPLDDAAWRSSLRLLKDEHRKLRAAVAGLTVAELYQPAAPNRKRPRIEHVRGIAAHDLYHAGQIRLLRRLMPS